MLISSVDECSGSVQVYNSCITGVKHVRCVLLRQPFGQQRCICLDSAQHTWALLRSDKQVVHL